MGQLKVVANEMMPVYENESGEKLVNARELHEHLVVKKDFTSWIKDRIEKYGFTEGEDFSPILVKSDGGRPRTEYFLTLDTAKEIAMVQNNEMGRAVRKYFIEVEKRAKDAGVPSYMIDDPIKRAEQWIEERKRTQAIESEKLMLEQRISEYEPKVTYLDTILNTKDTVTISQIAEDYGMSAQVLNKLLHELGVQYKVNKQWLLYTKHKSNGYTKSNTVPITHKDGTQSVEMHTKWTQKGRLFIYETLKKSDVLPLMDIELNKNIRLAK
ncbi:hypothetical protein BKM15_26165 [Pseudomonas syringae pv. syringae]|nr:hypothetical protein BKM15_26165 [Pseudomonas syringae pv. syringae]